MLRRRWPWFFMVVFVILYLAGAAPWNTEIPLGNGAPARLGPLAGVALGVIWQLVDRRDLADRLTVMAVFFVIAGVVQIATGDVYSSMPGLYAGLGVLAGLVLTEQVIRRSMGRHHLDDPLTASLKSH